MIAIPLTSPTGWQNLKFSRIPPNEIRFSPLGLEVAVNKSSSPLVFPLAMRKRIKSFTAKLEIDGNLNPSGEKWPEDAYLRVGLVVPGSRKLGRMESLFSPGWIKTLFKLAPPDVGIEKIYFYNLVRDASFIGQKRSVPRAEGLIEEYIVAQRPVGQKSVDFHYSLPVPVSVLALWLSLDGDDTGSNFKVRLTSLEIFEAD